MTSYHDIVKACSNEGIAMTEVDRVIVSEETYETLHEAVESRDVETSNYQTISGPAVRRTTGDEKLVYTDKTGRQREVLL